MNPYTLLELHYPTGSDAHRILLAHSRAVADMAVAVAQRLDMEQTEIAFVEEAALLHDIGIRFTSAPGLGCHGDLPYLAHGYKGREMLEAAGLPRHALVCDRHIGVGISAAEIRLQRLPLPERDLLPLSLAEQIVAYADLFFSKSSDSLTEKKPPEQVRQSLTRLGAGKATVFDAWHARFGT